MSNITQVAGIVHIDAYGLQRPDFKRGPIRKAMRASGREVAIEARRLVARNAVSQAGEHPGKDTGRLMRSIKPKIMRGGMAIAVWPQRAALGVTDDNYYPAYLWHGVRNGAVRRKDHQKQADNGQGWRIAPRANYMTDALASCAASVQARLTIAFADGLVLERL